MAMYIASNIIKELRKQKGLTQSDLAKIVGCSREQISKVERGICVPENYLFETILMKLGVSPDRFCSVITTTKELKIQKKFKEIKSLITIKEDYDKANEKLIQLEKNEFETIQKNKVIHQNFLSWKGALMGTGYNNHEAAFSLLFEAINLTIEHFDLNNICNYLLTIDEIHIIIKIAVQYSQQNNSTKCIEIYSSLISVLKNNYIDEDEISSELIMIYYNYSKHLGILEKHSESFKICEECIELMHRYQDFKFLPSITVNKACYYYFNNEIEKSKNEFKKAVDHYLAHGDILNADLVIDYTRKHFNLDLT